MEGPSPLEAAFLFGEGELFLEDGLVLTLLVLNWGLGDR
jgi:hypothetical protein